MHLSPLAVKVRQLFFVIASALAPRLVVLHVKHAVIGASANVLRGVGRIIIVIHDSRGNMLAALQLLPRHRAAISDVSSTYHVFNDSCCV